MTTLRTRYEIDAEDVIREVGLGWGHFAHENGVRHLEADDVVGRRLWDFIEGREVQHLYGLLYRQVRQDGRARAVSFRCDSATLRRFMRLEVEPLGGGGLACTCELLRTEARDAVALLEADQPEPASLLLLCSWCLCVRVGEADWLELEDAMQELRLLSGQPLPGFSHGACPRCERELLDELGEGPDAPARSPRGSP